MDGCASGCVGVRRCVGAWVHGAWVRGCVGAWVRGGCCKSTTLHTPYFTINEYDALSI